MQKIWSGVYTILGRVIVWRWVVICTFAYHWEALYSTLKRFYLAVSAERWRTGGLPHLSDSIYLLSITPLQSTSYKKVLITRYCAYEEAFRIFLSLRDDRLRRYESDMYTHYEIHLIQRTEMHLVFTNPYIGCETYTL